MKRRQEYADINKSCNLFRLLPTELFQANFGYGSASKGDIVSSEVLWQFVNIWKSVASRADVIVMMIELLFCVW